MSNAITKAIDPALQQIFDAMIEFMGTEYVQVNCYTNYDGTGINCGVNASDTDGNRWSYTEYQKGGRVTITPATATLGPAGTQQFTAAAFNSDGTPADSPVFTWSVSTGALGTVDATGLYTAPATIAASSFETVTAGFGTAWSGATITLDPNA